MLSDRSLRLIAISGFVFDDDNFYFELGQPHHWGRLGGAGGTAVVGIGAPKVRPDGTFPPHQALVRYLRRHWRCQVELMPSGYSYLLNETHQVNVLHQVDAHIPYLFLFTPPRLGGGDEVPDALVQAVYLLPMQRFSPTRSETNLVMIARSSLATFLARESWEMPELLEEPWADLLSEDSLPEDARLRPVLALRGLRHVISAGALPEALDL